MVWKYYLRFLFLAGVTFIIIYSFLKKPVKTEAKANSPSPLHHISNRDLWMIEKEMKYAHLLQERSIPLKKNISKHIKENYFEQIKDYYQAQKIYNFQNSTRRDILKNIHVVDYFIYALVSTQKTKIAIPAIGSLFLK